VRLSHCGPTWRMYTINHGSEGGWRGGRGGEWVGEGGRRGGQERTFCGSMIGTGETRSSLEDDLRSEIALAID